MGLRALGAGALAVVGGLLMVASGFAAGGLLLTALDVVEGEIPRYLGGVEGLTATLAVGIVSTLIALGGVTVVAGGVSLGFGHRTTGRSLILLGGGASFLGLLITFLYSSYRLGLSGTLAYTPYWVGVALAVAARRLGRDA